MGDVVEQKLQVKRLMGLGSLREDEKKAERLST